MISHNPHQHAQHLCLIVTDLSEGGCHVHCHHQIQALQEPSGMLMRAKGKQLHGQTPEYDESSPVAQLSGGIGRGGGGGGGAFL